MLLTCNNTACSGIREPNAVAFSSNCERRYICSIARVVYICDRLCINHPSPAKCKFRVRPKITAKSAQYRYSVLAIDVIYSVLATLCHSTMLRLRVVFPGATPLLPFTDKECGYVVNGTCKRPQFAVKLKNA